MSTKQITVTRDTSVTLQPIQFDEGCMTDAISEREHHRLLKQINEGLPYFTQVVPDHTKDNPTNYFMFEQFMDDVLHLERLGFFKEVTGEGDHPRYLSSLKEKFGRDFRAFAVTDLAKKMFYGQQPTQVN